MNQAMAQLKTPEGQMAARRMLWEAMDLPEDAPGLEGLGELPEGDESEDDGSEDDDDNAAPIFKNSFVQTGISDSGELTPEDAMNLDGDEGEDVSKQEREQEDGAVHVSAGDEAELRAPAGEARPDGG